MPNNNVLRPTIKIYFLEFHRVETETDILVKLESTNRSYAKDLIRKATTINKQNMKIFISLNHHKADLNFI